MTMSAQERTAARYKAETDAEIATLRRQVAALQRERLLLNPLRAGRIDSLIKYVDQLHDLAIESVAVRGSSPDSIPPKGGSSDAPMPSPVPTWAQDLFRREMREIGRRADRLAEWIASPRPAKRRAKKQCWECGRGLARGHLFCAGCGTAVPEDKETEDAS